MLAGITARARWIKILIEAPDAPAIDLAALWAMPATLVMRPADATEALECLDLALRHPGGPSVLIVSEQAVAGLAERPTRTHATRGGYVVAGTPDTRAATLVASGPELHIALAARALLQASGLAVAVVSLPCWSLFAAQDAGWRAQTLGTAPLVGVEASNGFGWERWLRDGLFVGVSPAQGSPAQQAVLVARAVERHLHGPAGALAR